MICTATRLSEEQQNAINYIRDNLHRKVIALAGPAGSGKTTVIRELQEELTKVAPVVVTATTNKAAVVLRAKGIESLTFHQACMRPVFYAPMDKLADFLERAHISETPEYYPPSLLQQYSEAELLDAFLTMKKSGIYAAFRQFGITDVFKYIKSWNPAPAQNGILIIDESSMLGDEELNIARRVYRYIVLVGDEFQLPPVKSNPVFWSVPDRIALTQIFRQGSGSQPLTLATEVRCGENLAVDVKPVNLNLCKQGVPIIVWRNQTREKLTHKIREGLSYKEALYPGEILICRNSSDRGAKDRGLYNNSMWTVKEVTGDWRCTLENDAGEILEDEAVFIEELNQGHGVPFRFGYVLTCHNAQGSEWDRVQIHAEDAAAFNSFNSQDAKRWLYTAITRAKEEVIWVSSEVTQSAN